MIQTEKERDAAPGSTVSDLTLHDLLSGLNRGLALIAGCCSALVRWKKPGWCEYAAWAACAFVGNVMRGPGFSDISNMLPIMGSGYFMGRPDLISIVSPKY